MNLQELKDANARLEPARRVLRDIAEATGFIAEVMEGLPERRRQLDAMTAQLAQGQRALEALKAAAAEDVARHAAAMDQARLAASTEEMQLLARMRAVRAEVEADEKAQRERLAAAEATGQARMRELSEAIGREETRLETITREVETRKARVLAV